MGGLDQVGSTYFHAEEDAPRKLVVVILDAEGRTNRHNPWSIEGDLRSADFHRGQIRSGVDGENNPECSLRRLGSVFLEHTGQGDPSRLGGNVGDSSPRRDQEGD